VIVTSAGQIGDGRPPYYVVIDRAWSTLRGVR
jgi:hypothetical protein